MKSLKDKIKRSKSYPIRILLNIIRIILNINKKVRRCLLETRYIIISKFL